MLKRCSGFVKAGFVALDEVGGGFADAAEGGDEFLFDAGDRAVEDGMGFVAKGGHCVFHQAFVIINRFVRIERAEILPV